MKISKNSLFLCIVFCVIQTEVFTAIEVAFLNTAYAFSGAQLERNTRRPSRRLRIEKIFERIESAETDERKVIEGGEVATRNLIEFENDLQKKYEIVYGALQKNDENLATLQLSFSFEENQAKNLVRMALSKKQLMFLLVYIFQNVEYAMLGVSHSNGCYIIGFKKENKDRELCEEPFIILRDDVFNRLLARMYYYDIRTLTMNKTLMKSQEAILGMGQEEVLRRYFEPTWSRELPVRFFIILRGDDSVEALIRKYESIME